MKTFGLKKPGAGNSIRAAVFLFIVLTGMRANAGEPMPWAVLSMAGQSKMAMVVEKKTQTLYLYTLDGEQVKVKKMACSTGKAFGDKKSGDDMRTPEGVYFIEGKIKEKKRRRSAASLSYKLDYPNIRDEAGHQPGKPVRLTVSQKELKPMDTDGSIAVESQAMKEIEAGLSLADTPVIIVEELGACPAQDGKDTKSSVESMDGLLSAWLKAMGEGSYHDVLALYSDDYMPDMAWWNTWTKVRKDAEAHGTKLTVGIADKSFFRDAGEFVAVFRMTLTGGTSVKDMGVRKLYIRHDDGGYRIVGDEIKKTLDGNVRNPLLKAAQSLCDDSRQEYADNAKKDVLKTLDDWTAAWASGDIDRYGDYYSDSFYATKMNKKAWLEKKRKLSSVNKNIQISIDKTVVEFRKEQARAVFMEDYRSSGHSSKGIKTLILVKEKDNWKILKETWRKAK